MNITYNRTAIILSRTSLSARPSPSGTTADYARRIWKCTARYCSMSWCYPIGSLSIAPRLRAARNPHGADRARAGEAQRRD